jgi:hypothetical protein
MSAVALLHAVGKLYRTAILRTALTSTSWGWDSSGSQKNIRQSSFPLAIMLPISMSPPMGPLLSKMISRGVFSMILLPVVPVA